MHSTGFYMVSCTKPSFCKMTNYDIIPALSIFSFAYPHWHCAHKTGEKTTYFEVIRLIYHPPCTNQMCFLKGQFTQKWKLSFYSVPCRSNLVCISFFCERQNNFCRIFVTEQHWCLFPLHEQNQANRYFSKNHLLCCTEESKSYRFGTAWAQVNDDRMIIFGWTIHLNYYSAHGLRH